MKQNDFGQLIFNETDVFDLIMQGRDIKTLAGMIVDDTVDFSSMPDGVNLQNILHKQTQDEVSVAEFHAQQQQHWHMPQEYKDLNIAEHVLGLCETDAELQRAGEELLLYQEHNLFDVLRYMKYLVDVMQQNQIIWGVGRGSSVSSFVLYKLGVHRINSMYYNLDIREFLR